MAKAKKKGSVEPVPEVANATGGVESCVMSAAPGMTFFDDPPMLEIDHGPILALYGSVLASVDWQRDVRRRQTICRDAFKIAVLAYEVFQENIKNKELT